MLKKRPVILLFGAIVWVILSFGNVSFAEETVKSAKDLIMELAPAPPAEPVRRTRGLVPRPVAPAQQVPNVSPRQYSPTITVPVSSRQEIIQETVRYPSNPPQVLVQEPVSLPVPAQPIRNVSPGQYSPTITMPVSSRQETIQETVRYPSNPQQVLVQEPVSRPVPAQPIRNVSPRQYAPAITVPVSSRQETIQEALQYPSNPPVQVVQSPPTGSATLSAVQFVYDSDELLPVAKRQLDQLVIALQDEKLRHTRIQLIGHTDATGSYKYNRTLSIRRARSAARYLTQVHGIPAYRVIPIGMGEDQLLDPYNPLGAINRRVEVVIVN